MSDDKDEKHQAYRRKLEQHGFRLEERLGFGSFGTVYRATHKQFSRSVAVKFFNVDLARGAENRKRFTREAHLLARVDHPSVPFVLTAGNVDVDFDVRVPYFVMQYIAGTRLDDEIKRSGKLEFPRAIAILADVLGALRAAHAESIVHRDVKPNNVIVGKERAYLVDFSIGVRLKYAPHLTRATLPSRGLGVSDYAAPEQLRDAANVDHRADIYAAGRLLFEMLVGHPKMHLPEISRQLAPFPVSVQTMIAKACAETPEHRYASVDDFLDALAPLHGGHAIADVDGLAICANAACGGAARSNNGYYFGPKHGVFDQPFCEACGKAYLRRCPNCGAGIPPSAAASVSRTTRSQREPKLFCSYCGSIVFEAPKCKKCASLLREEDAETDTAEDGCLKCRRRSKPFEPYDSTATDDEDIPF